MTVADLMSREVATVGPDTKLSTAVALMLDRRVSGLPVVDERGRVVGVLTEGDVMRREELGTSLQRGYWSAFFAGSDTLAQEFVASHSRIVRDVMTATPHTIGADQTLSEAVALMERHHVKRLPVVDANLRLIGVLSRADLLRPLTAALQTKSETRPEDHALRERVLEALRRERWWLNGPIEVNVVDGVVTLEGTVFDFHVGTAARVAAENVQGVRSVRNGLVWISPMVPFATVMPVA